MQFPSFLPREVQALSLAHQQLSLVFFNLILLSGMAMPLPLNIFAAWIYY